MSTGWNPNKSQHVVQLIINLLGNEYWLELKLVTAKTTTDYKPTGK